MKKNFPNPDIDGPGTSSHVAAATDFTGIAQNLDQAESVLEDIKPTFTLDRGHDPHLEAHLTKRMKEEVQHGKSAH